MTDNDDQLSPVERDDGDLEWEDDDCGGIGIVGSAEFVAKMMQSAVMDKFRARYLIAYALHTAIEALKREKIRGCPISRIWKNCSIKTAARHCVPQSRGSQDRAQSVATTSRGGALVQSHGVKNWRPYQALAPVSRTYYEENERGPTAELVDLFRRKGLRIGRKESRLAAR
ncbi:MAG TPA: hypothetical protein VGU20_18355 [Stellaceae bacterium]|nr:hypothetical protein [Stellaceae bacterium]